MPASHPCLSLKELRGWSNVLLSVCRNQTVTLDPAARLRVNVNRPSAAQSAGSELRLVRAACLIEMHYRSASPAGSEAAAIVHNLTAIGPQGEVGYSTASKVPLNKDKR